MGVPEDKLPFLFDEFYRVDESRNEKKGNGLGLYIVKYLVEAMGGSVRGGK
ncbi:ATP-binding protein [Roseburia yibonii]|uniref:ATP-binding protein n=1 Tax=Roseburia yibonii TaxID=2763063 RepID=UPI001FAE07F3|nr:ATP-binding protein [Roseburia yibonii]